MKMRKNFAKKLYERMQEDDRVYLITADLGFGMFDDIKRDFPDRFINCGASEQLMIGMAIGMTYENKIPVCYSITPFLLCRPFELLRTYVDHEGPPVKMVGGGRDNDYSHDGWSHHANDDTRILSLFKNIEQYRPFSVEELKRNFDDFIYSKKPAFMSLSKKITE